MIALHTVWDKKLLHIWGERSLPEKKTLKEKHPLAILTEEDLFNDDNFVYEKLKHSENKEILKKLSMVSPSLSIADDMEDYDFYTKNKLRYVNPKSLHDNSI